MWRFLVFLAISVSVAAEPRVEIRDNEVWLLNDGQARQLTSDERSKLQAILSPSKTQIAYYEQCYEGENCLTSVVILDMEGKRVKAFHVVGLEDTEPCASILYFWWPTETRIAAECHLNPSLGEYIETDLNSGKVTRDLLGLWFEPSPDGKYVAHGGWIIHFTSLVNQSDYLQIDKTTVYPRLKRGQRRGEAPDVVSQRGSTWTGIHEFSSGLSWSPDSARVALIDCVFDWVGKGDLREDGFYSDGDAVNRRCSVAIVARTGRSWLFPITKSEVDARTVALFWNGPWQLSVQIAGRFQTFDVH